MTRLCFGDVSRSEGLRSPARMLLMVAVGMLLVAGPATAANIYSGSSGEWTSGSTWIGGNVPSTSDVVYINGGYNVSFTGSNSNASASNNTVYVGNLVLQRRIDIA